MTHGLSKTHLWGQFKTLITFIDSVGLERSLQLSIWHVKIISKIWKV